MRKPTRLKVFYNREGWSALGTSPSYQWKVTIDGKASELGKAIPAAIHYHQPACMVCKRKVGNEEVIIGQIGGYYFCSKECYQIYKLKE
jgi:hypothetical protein